MTSLEIDAVVAALSKFQTHVIGKLSIRWSEAFYLRDETVWSPAPVLASLVGRGIVERRYHLDRDPTQYRLNADGLLVKARLMERRARE